MIGTYSGKTGVARFFGVDYPILSWILSAKTNRTNYRTSASNLHPVRKSGVIEEVLTISGVDYPQFLSLLPGTIETIEIGWYDTVLWRWVFIPFTGVLTNLQVQFTYSAVAQPAVIWTATFAGIRYPKIINEQPFIPNDVPKCVMEGCNLIIETSDFALHSGRVHHVRNATINYSYDTPLYYTSNYFNHVSANFNTFQNNTRDIIVDMIVEGDIDYWLASVETNIDPCIYKFWWNDGPTDFYLVDRAAVLTVDNFTTNVQTGDIISAHVQLGAAYG